MMLGQTEAFEVPPAMKLIVPHGHVSWWGVDPSTLRVAIATIDPEGRRGASMASFAKLAPAPRLVEIRKRTLELARDVAESLPPGLIVVEEPSGFGDRPNPQLAYAAAAIICALAEAAPTTEIKLVQSAKWKKAACGSGAIKKPKQVADYAVYKWATSLGYSGSSFDEVDAWGIADYARRTFALDPR